MKRAEIIVTDIGSTITKLSAFAGLGAGGNACFLGQGLGLTTVAEGDVVRGLEAARKYLEKRLAVNTRDAALMASSSAAGAAWAERKNRAEAHSERASLSVIWGS